MKVFIIALTKHEDIMVMANKAYNSAISLGYSPTIFDALTGDSSREYLKAKNIKPLYSGDPIVLEQQQDWLYRDGTIGCFCSHHSLWEKCVELNETIIIVEQDTIMLREWDDTLNWTDVLHLNCYGSLKRQNENNSFDLAAPIQPGVFEMKFTTRSFNHYVMNSATGYAIKPHAAQTLMDTTLSDGYMAVDRFIRSPVVKIDTINPPIMQEQPEALLYSTSSLR